MYECITVAPGSTGEDGICSRTDQYVFHQPGEWERFMPMCGTVMSVHLQKRSSKGVPSAVAKRRTHQIRGKRASVAKGFA